MITPVYCESSIYGRTLSTTSTKRFVVTFPGVVESNPDTIGANQHLHPMLRTPEHVTTPGSVTIAIGLPNESAPAYLMMEANISTDALGVQLRRAPTPAEIRAILAAWWDIRDAAILDADSVTSEDDSTQHTIDAFARVEHIIVAASLRTKLRDRNDPSSTLIDGVGPFARHTIRALPVLPSSQPSASQQPSATPLQQAIQKAIEESESNLGSIGNGYAWTVEQVAARLLAAMAPHVPGIDPTDYHFEP